jgi:acetoin utilization protein AcuB
MTTNIVTVSSQTPIMEARRTMEFHGIERLPVVDRGKLVGIVTKAAMQRATPSEATSLSVWEMNYLLAKMTVKEVMKRQVVTTSPDATVEEAVATAQAERVGSLPVMENNLLVGIVTTNDFFYKVLNPILGIGQSGSRIIVYEAGQADSVGKVMDCIARHRAGIKAIGTFLSSETFNNDLIVHLDTEDPEDILNELKHQGFRAERRSFLKK